MTAFIEDKSTILVAMLRFLAVAGLIAFLPSVYAAVLSALFGKTKIVVLVNCFSMLFLLLRGLGINLLWVDNRGAQPAAYKRRFVDSHAEPYR